MALLLNANNSVNRSYTITKPSPNHPLEVNGVGVRTENLFDKNTMTANVYLSQSDGQYLSSTGQSYSCIIKIKPNTSYRVRTASQTMRIAFFTQYLQPNDIPTAYYNHDAWDSYTPRAFIETSGNTDRYMVVFCYNNSREYVDGKTVDEIMSTVMVSEGAEMAVPYEPYGYKIPISSGGVTTNIYLGSTQTVRKIKKLVLTGEEDFEVRTSSITGKTVFRLSVNNYLRQSENVPIASHYQGLEPISDIGNIVTNNSAAFLVSSSGSNYMYIRDDSANTLSDFKSYLAAQYAAGTPVTIWYVLATPETAVVNEPLMKIGTYADTLSNAVQIPTTEGANSITVDTTVQPSEFTATWTGWHDAEVKEKSENLFDGSYTDGYIGGDTGTRYSTSSTAKTAIVKCEPNTTYTIKKIASSNRFTIATSASYPQDSEIVNVLFNSPTETTATITTPADASYLLIYVSTSSEQATPDMMLNTGSTALPYEPYWK